MRASCHVPAAGRAWPLGNLLSKVVRTSRITRSVPEERCAAVWRTPIPRRGCLVAVTLERSSRRSASGHPLDPGARLVPRFDDDRASARRAPVAGAVPGTSVDSVFGFQEFSRRAGDFALAMALVTFRVQSGLIMEPRVVSGGRASLAASPERGNTPRPEAEPRTYEQAAKSQPNQ